MKLVSWNVNGIRACVKKGFLDFFKEINADIFAIQESRLQEGQLTLELDGYYIYFNHAEKKGYSGTAIFTRIKPLCVKYGINILEHDKEGRVITLEYDNFYFVTVYTPNSKPQLERLEYRMKWEDDFRNYLISLNKIKAVIVCGDMNVAHNEIDLKNPKTNKGNTGFTEEERSKFNALLDSGYIDTYRYFYPDKINAYTWWSYRANARTNNVGWRIDYFCVSTSLKSCLKDALIHSDILGSDHCPVELELDIKFKEEFVLQTSIKVLDYDFSSIEKKWREKWETNPINKPNENKEKYYCLDMFPYPSGNGLHVGHWRGYVLSDVWSRYKILQGYEVLHPMGWDAFGLPAENDAIKKAIHPKIGTDKNVANFKRQLHEISAIYDWDKEVNTTDPLFYKWTQWIFVKMFEAGLAYEKQMPINWCPQCKTGLANEEATNGVCERCGSTVTKKNLRQWMLKITAYAERLLADLDKLDWPEKVKKMQADWIGKSYGAEIDFKVKDTDKQIKVFTTRPDTLYGATFMVLSPEHKIVDEITTVENKEEMDKYIFAASTKSSVDRMSDREKTGVFTGSYGINPLNGSKLPIWISDYVLADYGTGAIMCVPAHDNRDFVFAKKFNIPITQVIIKEGEELKILEEPYTDEGIMVNSDIFDGMKSSEAKETIANYLQQHNIGNKTINYKLRDWVFSRQRYWGEPIPIIHCESCGAVAVPIDQLPVELPDVESYQPTGTGESPLAAIDEWVNTICPKCGKPAKRETNTMPQWAGSSWYFLRYIDNKNNKELLSKEKADKWLPVDLYVGGIEHAVLHLLYSRFYTKFLKDIGVVDFDEPFQRLFNQGMVTKNGIKMSKSMGNVVSPDDLVRDYGCDSLRMYELFIGPPELDSEWDDRGIEGVYRYIKKTWKLIIEYKSKIIPYTKNLEKIRNKMVYEITNRLNNFSVNTVVSGFMEYTNKLTDIVKKENGIDKETLETLIILLAPFTPHLAEELWEITNHTGSVFEQKWPEYDETKMKEDTISMAVQINGKLRANIYITTDMSKEEVLTQAKIAIADKLIDKNIIKEIYVPQKIINFVIN